MNLIKIYNFHHHEQRNNVHKCKHRKIAPNGLSSPPTAQTYRLTRKSLSGAKNAFSFFMFQRRIIQILPMRRGANPDEWAATIHPCPTLLWTFNQRSPHLLSSSYVAMSWRQHTSSTQRHDNKQSTPFRFRSSFGRVSVYHRYPEYPTSTPGDTVVC